ncbi:hypothetical protein B0T11DRAFT_143563 [Plectosphaerella cucumerina]|uniref:Rhodopsin domain-containing protein n=1 Tax=Plectosphaerella cucumerina TaxID=40658 RepID=A0A8K0WY19_9PEZI|nr:hypothetical protein B0T11DRAFT_143563 [Plectosphaerella cucumerina]
MSLVPNIWAGVITVMPFAAAALVLRICARRMTRMGLGWDDCFSVAAWVFAVGYSALVLVWTVHFKLGQTIGHLPREQIDYYLGRSYLVLWISEFFYSWSICLSKLAVLTFYLRVFQFSSIRWPIIILIATCLVWIGIRTFFTIFRCSPVHYYWDRSVEGSCWVNVATYYLATDVTHTLLDCIIVALPIFEVLKIQLRLGQKIAVIGLFSCGFLVCIASAFQIVQSTRYDANSIELPHQLALSMIWGTVEVQLAVFASCLALLRPIFRKIVPGLSTADPDSLSRPSLAVRQLEAHSNSAMSPRLGEISDISLPHIHDADGVDQPWMKQITSSSLSPQIELRENRTSSIPQERPEPPRSRSPGAGA